ncbi:hypothetical protein BT93_G0330 [Corymbia citriodora subsp. variegata]|nr:hypothetical protein BT93_G0330 [Corymbia citriodora subsp. variegata]
MWSFISFLMLFYDGICHATFSFSFGLESVMSVDDDISRNLRSAQRNKIFAAEIHLIVTLFKTFMHISIIAEIGFLLGMCQMVCSY